LEDDAARQEHATARIEEGDCLVTLADNGRNPADVVVSVDDGADVTSDECFHSILLFRPEIGDRTIHCFSDCLDDAMLGTLSTDNSADLLRVDAEFFGNVLLLDPGLPEKSFYFFCIHESFYRLKTREKQDIIKRNVKNA
jgi:hypothetical protein